MKTKDKIVAAIGGLLVLIVALVWLVPTGLKTAPELAVPTIDGRTVRLEELRGRPVLVTFWATTCTTCVAEIPHLVDLYNTLAPKGFELIAVAMYYDPPNRVMEMAKRRALPYTVALDVDANASRAFGDVKLTPTSFLIAPDGRIVHQKLGEMDMSKVERMIRDMLPVGRG